MAKNLVLVTIVSYKKVKPPANNISTRSLLHKNRKKNWHCLKINPEKMRHVHSVGEFKS